MATWKVTTEYKKSVEEHEFWEKDGKTIIRVTGYRWGTWTVNTSDNNPPNFNRVRNPLGNEELDSVDMNNCFENNIEEVEMESLDDGWYSETIYPDDMDDDESERMSELWDEDSYEGWESEGWVQTDTECWVSCPLQCEKLGYKNVH